MKILFFFVLLSVQLSATTYSQNTRLSLSFSDVLLTDVLSAIRTQSDYTFVYNMEDIRNVKLKSVNFKEATLDEVLQQCLKNTGFAYVVEDHVVVVRQQQVAKQYRFSGVVRDKSGNPLPGVTVLIKGTSIGTATDSDGKFSITVADLNKIMLQFSFIGMQMKEVTADSDKPVLVVMEEDTTEMEEVVVNAGYFKKTKDSFTGSEVTVKSEELKKVGSLNVIQALSAFDPSMRLAENLEYGSDPNRVPEISIRGENGFDLRESADDSKTNPNAPLYILDGVEVSAERVYDLDINRVDEMTILKDATATALYGSRGANGVIVITTLRPKPGEIRVTLNANFDVSIPDLRDYNLMNAEEKLRYELLAGRYTPLIDDLAEAYRLEQTYNQRLEEVKRGVDTYWLSKPLQRSLNQRYSLYFEGGDASFRYGIDLSYAGDKGVMKESGRKKVGVGVTFQYNIGENFYVRNDVIINDVKGDNSPYGNFSEYAKMNPYERSEDEDGNLIAVLSGGEAYNPLLNASLPNFSYSTYTSVQDNFNLSWRIIPSLKLDGRFSYTKQLDKSEEFKSPKSTDFVKEEDAKKKGSYAIDNSKGYTVDANATLAYFKNIGKGVLSLGIGTNLTAAESRGEGFTATGFAGDNVDYVGAANQFKEDSKPRASYDKSRMIGFFTNLNYGYDNRYFLDFSYRTDGSSKFGRNSRFAPFWSFGLAWNVHKEHFWDANPKNQLKLRASTGTTGSVSFSSAQALTTYYYDFENEYNGYYGVDFTQYGNPGLKWQTTHNYNVGLDWTFWNGRITFNGDFYIKKTDNLLLPVDVAPSTGFVSYVENLGESKNTGLEGRLRMTLIDRKDKDLNWNITLAAFRNRNKITKLSNQLEKINEKANENVQGVKPLRVYETGRSQSALMVVRSAGIDPATGNELYIKRDGSLTFVYDYNDRIIAGDMYPKIEGNISSNLSWKGFNLYLLFKYRYGGKAYNSTLASKVEGTNSFYNADKRVLEDRWKQPGDHSKFRRINALGSPYQTTRLVFDDNLLSLQSVSISYDLPLKFAQRLYLQRVKVLVSTTDVFRLSTIRQERGTQYPFARAFSAGLNVTF